MSDSGMSVGAIGGFGATQASSLSPKELQVVAGEANAVKNAVDEFKQKEVATASGDAQKMSVGKLSDVLDAGAKEVGKGTKLDSTA